jgi:hypothetical protein
MKKYRKKPAVIEAVQITDEWFDGRRINPLHIIGEDILYNPYLRVVKIKTLEGTMVGVVGDWIIKGVRGEYYPCKPDIFEETYEKVEEK